MTLWHKAVQRFVEKDSKQSIGTTTPNPWQLASNRFKKKTESDEELSVQEPPKSDNSVMPLDKDEQAVMDLLVQNGQTSANTFYNLLKSQGFKILAPVDAKQECVSASSNAQVLRSKESRFKMRGMFDFLESKQEENGVGFTRFRCVIIQEGLGNFGDSYYYTRNALESAVPIFEGKKIYADHPDRVEEQTRPERSVKDVLGHFENVSIQESDDGRAQLVADVVILPDEPYRWARALMRHSVEYAKKYPDKDFIGLSINASGDSHKMSITDFVKEAKVPETAMNKIRTAMEKGVEEIRLVTTIREAISCDLVTEAGAGGKVINLIEGDKKMEKDIKKESEMEKKEAADMPKEADAPAHDDAAEDKELIRSMIAKHLKGDSEEEPAEDEMEMAMEAYEYHSESDKDKESCSKKAIESMKCAKHLASKNQEAKVESEEKKESDESKKESDDKDADDEKKKESEEKKESKEEDCKEASAAKLLTENAALKGELAALKETAKKKELNEYIESKLAESKLPRKVTKNFMEGFADVVTSKEKFDKYFESFAKSFKAEGGEAHIGDKGFAIMTERTVKTPASGKASLSFADCKR